MWVRRRNWVIIQKINIYGYGKWLNTTFPLAPSLQVFYGPNEAGKSTLIDFIVAILFGFQNKRQAVHGQYIPKDHADLYGGEIWFENQGKHYRIVRTRGKNGGDVKFFDADLEMPLPASLYDRLISPLDRQTYQQLFYFNGEDQQAAYRLDATALQLRIQQVGLANADQWIALQQDFQKQAKELYAERGRKPELNRQLKQYREIQDQLQDAQTQYPKYQALKAKLADQSAALSKARAQLTHEQEQARTDQQKQAMIPLLEQYRRLPDVDSDDLRSGFSDQDVLQYRDLNRQLAAQSQRAADQKRRLATAEQSLLKTPAQQFYEQNQARIDQLMTELSTIKQTMPQLTFVDQRITAVEKTIGTLEAELPRNAAGKFPQSLSTDDTSLVLRLTAQRQPAVSFNDESSRTSANRRQRHQATTNRVSPTTFYFVAIGLVVLTIIGHRLPFSWLGYFLAAGIAAYGLIQASRPQAQPTPNQPTEPARSTEAQRRLAEIASRYQLTGIPAEQWVAIQPQLQRLESLQADLAGLSEQKRTLFQNYQAYLEKWRFAADWLPLSNEDYQVNLGVIERNVSDWQNQVRRYQERNARLKDARQAVDAAMEQMKATQAALDHSLAERRVSSGSEFDATVEKQQQLRQNLQVKSQLMDQLKSANIPISLDIEEFKAAADQHTKQQRVTQDAINQLTKQSAETQVSMTQLVNDRTYFDLKQRLANQEAKILETVHQYLALSLSGRWIQAVLDLGTRGRLPKAIRRAIDYFGILTDQRYHNIEFGDQVTVTRNDGVQFVINELSKGTLEQLYLALIFAIAVSFSDEYPMPIIIDDGFMSFDANRKQAAFTMMAKIAQQTQVIYLTAQQDYPQSANVIDLSRK